MVGSLPSSVARLTSLLCASRGLNWSAWRPHCATGRRRGACRVARGARSAPAARVAKALPPWGRRSRVSTSCAISLPWSCGLVCSARSIGGRGVPNSPGACFSPTRGLFRLAMTTRSGTRPPASVDCPTLGWGGIRCRWPRFLPHAALRGKPSPRTSWPGYRPWPWPMSFRMGLTAYEGRAYRTIGTTLSMAVCWRGT